MRAAWAETGIFLHPPTATKTIRHPSSIAVSQPATEWRPCSRVTKFSTFRECMTHGVIPGSSHTPALGISSPGINKAHPRALQSWRTAMEHYVGLDVSLKLTAICIVDRTGKIEREGVVASDPETIAAF